MKNFKTFLKESSNMGLEFEPCLIAVINKDEKAIKRFDPALVAKAKSAVSLLPKNIKWACKVGPDGIRINLGGNAGSPKTDIFFDTKENSSPKYHCSVKLDGAIQLASVSGKTSAQIFKLVASQALKKDTKARKYIENNVVKSLESMNSRFVDGSKAANVAKVKERNPNFYKKAFDDKGKLRKDYDYKAWEAKSKASIVASVVTCLTESDTFRFALTEELLTGKYIFANSPLAIANCLLTPSEFYPEITSKVVKYYASITSYVISAKSTHGISSPNFRAITENVKDGTEAEVEKAIQRAYRKNQKWLEESKLIKCKHGDLVLCEGFWDKVKEIGAALWNKITTFFNELLLDIKERLISWYERHCIELANALIQDDTFVLE